MAGERQVAIVTGAASGIGRAMSLGLLEGGIDVAAVDREPAWLDELKAATSGRRFSGALQTIRADLTDPTSFETIVSAVLGEFRPDRHPGQQRGDRPRLDPRRPAAQPAALLGDHAGTMEPLCRGQCDGALDDGAGGRAAHAARQARPHRHGHHQPRHDAARGYILYGASKAAAEAATAIMSADLAGTGVTANVLVPGGMTDTRIIADGAVADRSRLLRPEIMAPPLVWLVSDAAAQVTGRRFLAVHWDTSLPPAEAAEKCGAPIAWKSIATMPIEPD